MGYDYSKFADDDFTHGPDALRYAIDPFISANASVIQASQNDLFDFTKKPNFTTVEGMQEALRVHYANEYNLDIKKKNEEDAEKMFQELEKGKSSEPIIKILKTIEVDENKTN